MEFSSVKSCHFVKSARVLGVHKQGTHKLSHYFIVMVTWNDNSQVTVYRKWRQIKSFQGEIIRSLKVFDGNVESRRYLKKTAQLVRDAAQLGRGTMRKLKMIDSLNDFFSAATHYKDLMQSKILRQFLKPNEIDMTAGFWSKSGKTYLYVSRDTFGERWDRESTDFIHNVAVNSIRTDTAEQETQQDAQTGAESDQQSSPASYIALADFDGWLTDSGEGVFSLQQDEEVEVVQQSESGWWLVRKPSEDHGSEKSPHCGYVPASYLRQSTSDDSVFSTKSFDEIQSPIPVFASTTLIPDDLTFEETEVPHAYLQSPAPKKSILDRLRNEFIYDSSDSEQSNCSSEFSDSSEIVEMSDKLGDLTLSGSRSATSSPVIPNKLLDSPRMWANQKSRRRNTLAHTSFEGLLKPATTCSPPKMSKLAIHTRTGSLIDDNLCRSSSTGNIAIHLKGEDYICKKSFEATSAEEISFNEASVVKVLRRNSDGWWLASYNGKVGLVPGVHLQKYKDPIRRMSIQMLNVI